MKKSFHYYLRKSHRYLGLLIGVQFLAWTISGLYFAWTNLAEVHGDPQMKASPLLAMNEKLVAPDSIWHQLKGDSLLEFRLIDLLGIPTYQVTYLRLGTPQSTRQVQLADARTGKLRAPLTQQEAVTLAKSRFAGEARVRGTTYLTETDPHHEYREQPLPAYAVEFDHPTRTTVYVAAQLGTVVKYRNRSWRIFDFLWMGHTMDYRGRDNINNWLLRIFSIAGLITVLSGFLLYVVSGQAQRQAARKKKKYNNGKGSSAR